MMTGNTNSSFKTLLTKTDSIHTEEDVLDARSLFAPRHVRSD